jgi:predicted ArsR family transcriptional regulator
MANTPDRLLYELKSRGPQGAATLAAACAITPMGAHKQLQALSSQGLVAFHDEPQGIGRPRRIWSLTDAGHGRFPDRHGDLAVQLLRHAAERLGSEALDTLIGAREAEAEQLYRQQLARANHLGERVQLLADVRRQEGYMARAEPMADGGWLLIEDHCPICAAATQCQGFCRSELALFQRCLGPDVRVERTEHLLSGARRCAYLVRPA